MPKTVTSGQQEILDLLSKMGGTIINDVWLAEKNYDYDIDYKINSAIVASEDFLKQIKQKRNQSNAAKMQAATGSDLSEGSNLVEVVNAFYVLRGYTNGDGQLSAELNKVFTAIVIKMQK